MPIRICFLTLLLALLPLPAVAQHCGFDFTRIMVVHEVNGNGWEIASINLLIPPYSRRVDFWKNGERTHLRGIGHYLADYRCMDSNYYWFAGTGFIYAGSLRHDSVTAIVVRYKRQGGASLARRPDTLFIDPLYSHPLCSNFTHWEYDSNYVTREFFEPLTLDLSSIRNRDTIRRATLHLWTTKQTYHIGDTVIVVRPVGAPFDRTEVKTDGECASKIVYGIMGRVGGQWKDIRPLYMIQAACGMPHSWLPVRFKTTSFETAGEYKITFYAHNWEILETEMFWVE